MRAGVPVISVVISVVILVTVGLVAFRGVGARQSSSLSTKPSAFVLPSLDGAGRVALTQLRGRPVVVSLFASWCSACAQELPAFVRAAHHLRGRVTFVAVDSLETGDGPAMARRYRLSQAGILLARDVGGMADSGLHDSLVTIRGLPVTAFYGPRGALLATHLGLLTSTALNGSLERLYGPVLPSPSPAAR